MSSILILSTQLAFLGLGNHLTRKFFIANNAQFDGKDGKNNVLAVGIMSICFSSSLSLLLLLGFEMLNIFSRTARLFFLKANLIALVLLSVLIIPFLLLQLITTAAIGKSSSKIPTIVFLIYLWCFYRINSVFPVIDSSGQGFHFIEQGVGRIGIVGVTLLAFLSGYGSVAGPAAYLFIKKVSSENVEQAGARLKQAQSLLESKKNVFQDRKRSEGINQASNDGITSWLFNRVSATINLFGEDDLAEEIADMELAVSSLESDHRALNADRDRHLFSQTFQGKFLAAFGHFLSIYCVYRIFSALLNVLLGRMGKADPITVALGFFVHIFGVDWNINLWAKEISFIFVGSIIVSSIRNFLVEFQKIFKIVDRFENCRAIMLFSSQLMALYMLSTLLMLRFNLPIGNRPLLTELLGSVQFDFFERWFEAIYLLSALLSIVYIYLNRE